MLDLGGHDSAAGADGGEGADEGVLDDGAGPDGDGAADGGPGDGRPGADVDAAVDDGGLVDLAVDGGVDPFEEESVGFEEGGEFPGVDPPAGQEFAAHPASLVDEPLDGVGDLEFTARRGFDGGDGLVDTGVEEVHADEGEVGRWVGGLLDESDHVAGVVEFGDAEPVRVGHLLEEDLRVGWLVAGARRAEGVDEGGEVLFQEVVAEVHDEVVLAEELPGDEHAVGEPEGLVLWQVGDGGPEGRAVAEGVHDLVSGVADDDTDLGDAG